MNAIHLLEADHQAVKKLFAKLEKAKGGPQKLAIFNEIADALAIHATIEERIFYPAVRAKRTEDILLESVEEHLAIKRVIADLLRMSPADEMFEAKCTVLKEEVEHHVEEEEGDLFVKVKKLLDAETLASLGDEMHDLQIELEDEDAPRNAVLHETGEAASI